ncbi:MAG: MlaD family protein [Candidatus Binatia bacterium]
MSKRFSPAAVGAFVVGAVTLAVIAVVMFGSGRLFRKTYPCVLYFSGDVNGLNVGAPVKLKGVEIGSVTAVKLNLGQAALLDRPGEMRIPVLIEIDADRLAQKGAKSAPTPENLQRLIDRGLRAQLAMQSFVTGLLYVKTDFFPGSPINLVNDPTVSYPELPTIPTPMEQVQAKAAEFLAKLNEADVAGLVVSLHNAVGGLDRMLNSPHLKATLETLPGAVDGLKSVSADAKSTLTSLRKLADDLDAKLGPLGGTMQATASDARETLRTTNLTLQQMQTLLKPDAPLAYSLQRSLNDLSAAARAFRQVAEELEHDPSALLRGKGAVEEAK